MSNSKISALTAATTPVAGTEVLPIVQSSATVKVAVSDLTAGRSVSGANFVVTSSTIPANGVYLPAANSVGVATNSGLKAIVDASGNVGIGVSSVDANFKAQFLGTAGSNTSAATSGTTQSASAILRLQAGGGFTGTLDIGQGGATGSWLQSCDTTNLATTYSLLLNPVGGNVGIGTSSPSAKLHVAGGSLLLGATGGEGGEMAFQNVAGTASSASLDVDGSNNFRVFNISNTAIQFFTNSAERVRIPATGGLSIGTTVAAPVGGIAVTPSAGVASLDSSNATVTLAAAGTQTFPSASGMLLVTSFLTGATYLYICGGGATAQVSNVGSSIGTFTFNGTSYVFTNTTLVSQTYGFMFFRTRNSA